MEYQELAIIKGYPTPTTTTELNSNEDVLDTLDMLSGGKGFGIAPRGWIPQFSQLKDGGLFADNPLIDNDVYLNGSMGKVTQTMTLLCAGASPKGRYYLESKLRSLNAAAAEYHYTQHQHTPVYLKWTAPGGSGPQYTLIYNIQIAQNREPFEASKSTELTITITHEAEWWPIPPGSTPRLYANEKGYAGSNPLSLIPTAGGGATFMVSETISGATIVLDGPVISSGGVYYQSYIDIPAALIPGDAPALALFYFGGVGNDSLTGINYKQSYIIGRRTRGLGLQTKVSGTTRSSFPVNTWPARVVTTSGVRGMLETTAGTDATYQTDTGVYSNGDAAFGTGGSTTRERLRVTFATATDQIRLTWKTDMATFAGRWHAFLRGHQSGGTFGQVSVYLQYGYDGNDVQTNPVNPTLQAVVTNTPYWPLVDLGIVTFPPDNTRAPVNLTGNSSSVLGDAGLLVNDVQSGAGGAENLTVRLRASRSGATAELYVADLVLIPIDEAAAYISYESLVTQLGSAYSLQASYLDTTRHMARGLEDIYCAGYTTGSGLSQAPEISTAQFYLRPGVTNRIYILSTSDAISASPPTAKRSAIVANVGGGGAAMDKITVAVDIIPRYYGVRTD